MMGSAGAPACSREHFWRRQIERSRWRCRHVRLVGHYYSNSSEWVMDFTAVANADASQKERERGTDLACHPKDEREEDEKGSRPAPWNGSHTMRWHSDPNRFRAHVVLNRLTTIESFVSGCNSTNVEVVTNLCEGEASGPTLVWRSVKELFRQ